jgi:ABC-type transport system substrate-binding protein
VSRVFAAAASAISTRHRSIDTTTASFSSANWNWGHFTNPKIDELLAKAQETFVPTERDNVLASVSLVRLSGRRLCAFLRALPLRWAI